MLTKLTKRDVSVRCFCTHKKVILTKLMHSAVSDAMQFCDKKSDMCAIAWDKVRDYEVALSALSAQEAQEAQEDALDIYCDDHPSDLECRIYEV